MRQPCLILLLLVASGLLAAISARAQEAPDPDQDARTLRVRELLAQPVDQRPPSWREDFYALVYEAPLFAPQMRPQTGPDGYPYLVLHTTSDEDSVAVTTIAELLPRLTEVGVGIVLDPGDARPPEPGWVFHYGDLVCHRMYGNFEVRSAMGQEKAADESRAESLVTAHGEVEVAPPSESYLPLYVRKVLRDFLQSALGMHDPRVVLIRRANSEQEPELAFNIFPEGFDDPKQLGSLLIDLTWFFPRHYSLTAVSSTAFPASSYGEL